MHASYEKIALILIVSLAMFSLNAQASEIDAMYPTDIEYVLEISNTCKSTTYSSSIISAQRTCVYADSDIYTCIPNSGIDWNKLPTSSSMKNIITDAYNLFTTIHVKLNPRVWCEETKKCCVSYRDVSVDNRIKICDSLGAGIVKSSECPDNKKVFWIRTDYAFEDEDLICCKGASISSNVKCIGQPARGWCGQSSTAMLICYHTGKCPSNLQYPSASEFSSLYGIYSSSQSLVATLNNNVNKVLIQKQWDLDGFYPLQQQAKKRNTVIIGSKFPVSDGAGGYVGSGQNHYMVVVGYNTATSKYIVNNPNVGSCSTIELPESYFRNNPYGSYNNIDTWYAYF